MRLEMEKLPVEEWEAIISNKGNNVERIPPFPGVGGHARCHWNKGTEQKRSQIRNGHRTQTGNSFKFILASLQK